MAEIVDGGGGGGGKHGKKKAKKGSARIDMTPMVDLAFLLLTFFVLASTLSKPKALEIVYPKETDKKDETTKLDNDLATTLLLGEDEKEIYYYTGVYKPDSTELKLTDFSSEGFRKVMLDKNGSINDQVNQLKAKLLSKEISEDEYQGAYKQVVGNDKAPFVVIKTIGKTKFKNVINALDELNITNVRKRAIQDMAESEAIAVRQQTDKLGILNQ
jgi:biopolymer transport protein ExbD